jgi:hypothetical protein
MRRERGQVLVIGLFVVVGLFMVAITVANVGIVVAEKIRAQDTVDAAAYSAAVMEARYMNLVSYVNRAMVANYNSMAFNTALWSVFDADDHGIAVVTALMYQVSAILFVIPVTTGFAPTVDSFADLLRDVVHKPLHAINHQLNNLFAQDEQDLNQYIELFNKDVLTMLEGILYAATQSARHEVIEGVAKEMNPKLLTTSVLGLGAEAANYDELARAVEFVIRDTDVRGGFARMLNSSFKRMHNQSNFDNNNPLYLAAVTEASLDNFTAGRTREGQEDLLRNFNTGNIARGVTDAAEIALDVACYAACLIFCDCDADVRISLGASMRDGYENKAFQTHVPFIARRRMRQTNLFGLNFQISGIPGGGQLSSLLGSQGHTSGDKFNDIANVANTLFSLEEGFEFDLERMVHCFLTGCKLNQMNITQASLMLPTPVIVPLFVDDHWDGTFDGVEPVCTWEILPPAVCMEESINYFTKLLSEGTEKGVPKYDWQVDLDNLGFANYTYPDDKGQARPEDTSAGDDKLVGPSIGVVGVKRARDIPGLQGLGLGNDYPITAISRAQVYYLRNPNRPDEKPSLFNPHWVPRLAPLSGEDTPVMLRKIIPYIANLGAPFELTH